MPVIKRYPNRKLYDTEAKRYVTLEGIATLIREGQEVQVTDYASGEDLTSLTLTQVIFELEKRRSGFLPQKVLAGLIEAGGDTLGTLRRSLASPLEMARHVDEEIERRVQALVRRGELAAEEGLHLRELLLSRSPESPEPTAPTDDEIEQVLIERGVPTRQDLQQILEQIDELEARLGRL